MSCLLLLLFVYLYILHLATLSVENMTRPPDQASVPTRVDLDSPSEKTRTGALTGPVQIKDRACNPHGCGGENKGENQTGARCLGLEPVPLLSVTCV